MTTNLDGHFRRRHHSVSQARLYEYAAICDECRAHVDEQWIKPKPEPKQAAIADLAAESWLRHARKTGAA